MATQLQFRRGTSAQNNSYTGLVGEISLDTETNNIEDILMVDLTNTLC